MCDFPFIRLFESVRFLSAFLVLCSVCTQYVHGYMHQFLQVVCVCLVLKSTFPAIWTRRSRNSRIWAWADGICLLSTGCLRLFGTEEHFSRDLDKALRFSDGYAPISSGCFRFFGTVEHFSRDLDKGFSKFPDICINFFRLLAFVWY